MSEPFVFHPPRRRGLLFHSIFSLALAAASAFSVFYVFSQPVGAYFVLLLLIAVLLAAPLPLLLYRSYALLRAYYVLERDGLRLRWGLRAEDIPLSDIEWVRRSTDLASTLRLPRLSMPGALVGTINQADLGPVEYMAAASEPLLLIATPQKVYAISPEDPEAFLRAFQRSLELGSLTPLDSISIQPAAYAFQVWRDRPARILLISGLLVTMLLFVATSLSIPGRSLVSLGFYPNGQRVPGSPAPQLLLLPFLAAFIFLVDLAAGLVFYRTAPRRPIAYMLWGGGLLAALLLAIGVGMILL